MREDPHTGIRLSRQSQRRYILQAGPVAPDSPLSIRKACPMNDAKRQHFVPEFYLRRFADNNGRVTVRCRDGRSFTTSTSNILAEVHGYRVPGRPLTAEPLLGQAETGASIALEEVDALGRLPVRGSKARNELAVYMALQLSRTPDLIAHHEFEAGIRSKFGDGLVPAPWMRKHLADLWGFTPRDPEVSAACDLVNLAPTFDSESVHEFRIETMFDIAVRTVAPHIEAREWSLEVSRVPCFFSSDRPVSLWSPASEKLNYQGVGIVDAEALWFPLDPGKALVARRGGASTIRRIGPERRAAMNCHVGRHCTSLVFSRPDLADLMPERLNRRRPVLRFWEGPMFHDSGRPADNDVLHSWKPLLDIPDSVEDPYAFDQGSAR